MRSLNAFVNYSLGLEVNLCVCVCAHTHTGMLIFIEYFHFVIFHIFMTFHQL